MLTYKGRIVIYLDFFGADRDGSDLYSVFIRLIKYKIYIL
jgi:hypothetical protein